VVGSATIGGTFKWSKMRKPVPVARLWLRTLQTAVCA